MIGAILGDIFGSRFEFSSLRNNKSKDIELIHDDCYFTDDTVLTLATKYAIVNNIPFADAYYMFGSKYPYAGYGASFQKWMDNKDKLPYNSCGNGSAMRISPIIYYYDGLDIVLKKAKESAECTHNHSEGIKGAVATAHCMWMAKNKFTKKRY